VDKGNNTTGESRVERHTRHPKKKRKVRKVVLIILCAIFILIASGLAMAGMSIKPPTLHPSTMENEENAEARKDGIYNVLVVGTDKVGLNTDTILVMSLDSVQNRASVISIPRDTMSNVKRSVKKINAAYAIGAKNGKGNIDNLKLEVSYLLGFEVDNYVVVNLSAFEEIIDAIGGVTIDVPRNMDYDDPYQDLHIHLSKGLQTLNGQQAIGFVRYRSGYAEGDLGRVKAQQSFIQTLAKQLASPATLTKVPKLAEIILRNMDTDLTNGELVWFAKEALEVDMETNLNMFVLPGAAQYVNRLSYYLPNETEILTIVNEYFNPSETPITQLNIVNVSNVVQQETQRQSGLTAEQRRQERLQQERIENEATVNEPEFLQPEPSETGPLPNTTQNSESTPNMENPTNPEGQPSNGTTTTEPTPSVPVEPNPPAADEPSTEQTGGEPAAPNGSETSTPVQEPVPEQQPSNGTDSSGYNTIPGEVLKQDAAA